MITYKQSKTVDIVLQPRIGDAILSFPAISCLKQLNKKYEMNLNIRVISSFSGLNNVIQSFDTGNSSQLSVFAKALSWVVPADVAFFLAPTTKNWGYKAKDTYGLFNPFRKYVKYDHQAEYISFDKIDKLFPQELIAFLKENFSFSTITISTFGVCLDMGFSADQIIQTFKFNANSFRLTNELTSWKPKFKENTYVVFCMEAASNRPVDADRRWDEGNYLSIAEKIYADYGINSVFIGLNKKSPIYKKPYFLDLRGKLDMIKLSQVLKLSKGYIGNDTGPLHIANLLQKPSVGVYFREASTRDFTPIFPHLNKIVFKPDNLGEVFSQVQSLLN